MLFPIARLSQPYPTHRVSSYGLRQMPITGEPELGPYRYGNIYTNRFCATQCKTDDMCVE